jgi:hypothetical protein
MTPRQDDAAMIDFGGWAAGVIGAGQGDALNQGSAAGGAPIGHGVLVENGAALGADFFHMQEIN